MRIIKTEVNKRRMAMENTISTHLQNHPKPLQYLQDRIDMMPIYTNDPVEEMMNKIELKILMNKLRRVIHER